MPFCTLQVLQCFHTFRCPCQESMRQDLNLRPLVPNIPLTMEDRSTRKQQRDSKPLFYRLLRVLKSNSIVFPKIE